MPPPHTTSLPPLPHPAFTDPSFDAPSWCLATLPPDDPSPDTASDALASCLASVQGALTSSILANADAFVGAALAAAGVGADVAAAADAARGAARVAAAATSAACVAADEADGRLKLAKRRTALAAAVSLTGALAAAVRASAALSLPPRGACLSHVARCGRDAGRATDAAAALPPGIGLRASLVARAEAARSGARRALAATARAALLPTFDAAAAADVAAAYEDAGDGASFGSASGAAYEGAVPRAALAAAVAAAAVTPSPSPTTLAPLLASLPPEPYATAVTSIVTTVVALLECAAAAGVWAAGAPPGAAAANAAAPLAQARADAALAVERVVGDLLAAPAAVSSTGRAAAARGAARLAVAGGSADARSALSSFLARTAPSVAAEAAAAAYADGVAASRPGPGLADTASAAVGRTTAALTASLDVTASAAPLPAVTVVAPLAAIVDGYVAGCLDGTGPAPLSVLAGGAATLAAAAASAPVGTALSDGDAPPRLCARLARALARGGVLDRVKGAASLERRSPGGAAPPSDRESLSAAFARAATRASVALSGSLHHDVSNPPLTLPDRVAVAASLDAVAAAVSGLRARAWPRSPRPPMRAPQTRSRRPWPLPPWMQQTLCYALLPGHRCRWLPSVVALRQPVSTRPPPRRTPPCARPAGRASWTPRWRPWRVNASACLPPLRPECGAMRLPSPRVLCATALLRRPAARRRPGGPPWRPPLLRWPDHWPRTRPRSPAPRMQLRPRPRA